MIAERFPPDIGGLAKSGERTAQTLARIGADVDVLAFTRQQAPGALETIAIGAVRVHRFGLFSGVDLSLQHALNLVEALHRERRYDLVWGHYLFPAGFFAVVAAGLLGARSVVSARGNDVDRLMFPPGDFGRLRWTLERADCITAVSRELCRKIDVLVGKNVEQVPNAVDLSVFAPGEAASRERFGIAPDATVLAFGGELRHKKGLPFLLDALVRVGAERPACLLVIGEVRPRELPQLHAFAAEHPDVARRVVETGHLTDAREVAACYRLSDLYLQPSVWEGLPNALLEAMACECLVLASDAGAIGEVVEHGKSGFLLPKTKLHRLGGAALELLGLSDDERAAIGKAARERVASAYAPADEERALSRVVARVLGDNSAR